jgi:antibiotic biosynthesis monooxygenase (ABM) superfamily enzyme
MWNDKPNPGGSYIMALVNYFNEAHHAHCNGVSINVVVLVSTFVKVHLTLFILPSLKQSPNAFEKWEIYFTI